MKIFKESDFKTVSTYTDMPYAFSMRQKLKPMT